MILYIHTNKEIFMTPEDRDIMKSMCVHFGKIEETEDWYIITPQKICLKEEDMSQVMGIIDEGYTDRIKLQYSDIDVEIGEVFLFWG